MSKFFSGALMLAAVAAFVPSARADDFFEVFAFPISGSHVINSSAPSILPLVDNLFDATGALAPVGVNGVVEISPGRPFNQLQNQIPVLIGVTSGTSAFVGINGAPTTLTFTGNNAALDTDVRAVFEHDVDGYWGSEVKQLDKQSAVMPLDGNPQASTAFMATSAFESFGMRNPVAQTALAGDDNFNIAVNLEGGLTRANGYSGDYGDASILATWRITDALAFSADTALQYRIVSTSTAYTFGEVLGVPIDIFNEATPETDENGNMSYPPPGLDLFPFNSVDATGLQVTPWFVAAMSASWSDVMGALLLGGGYTADLTLVKGSWTFGLVDQISYMNSIGVPIGDINFDDPVSQLIMKNGVNIAWQPINHLFLDGGITFSNLFSPAAVPNYWTATAGVGFKFSANSGIRVGYIGDFGSNYTSNGGQFDFWLTF